MERPDLGSGEETIMSIDMAMIDDVIMFSLFRNTAWKEVLASTLKRLLRPKLPRKGTTTGESGKSCCFGL